MPHFRFVADTDIEIGQAGGFHVYEATQDRFGQTRMDEIVSYFSKDQMCIRDSPYDVSEVITNNTSMMDFNDVMDIFNKMIVVVWFRRSSGKFPFDFHRQTHKHFVPNCF